MTELLPIRSAAAAIRAGQLSPAAVLDQCLARIQRSESAVRAWVIVDEQNARAAARDVAAMVRAGGDPGPLAGIPIGIKDLIDVRGLPTQAGSSLRAAHVADADAPLVARLRTAGAVIVGKTVTTEFAYLDPAATRNPWNLAHTPGGSSSGSAAAVAAGMCLAAIGTQTGGSVIRPAAFCGIAGFKPTFGRINVSGVVELSRPLDTAGVLARSVDDLRIMWEVLGEGADAGFSDTRNVKAAGDPPRLGWIEEYFTIGADDPVRQAFLTALETLAKRGARLVPVELPASFKTTHEMHLRIMARGAAEQHGDALNRIPDRFGPRIAELIRLGLTISDAAYAEALAHQRQFQEDLYSAFARDPADAWLLPSAPTVAPANLNTTGDPRFNSPWTYAGVPACTIPCGLDAATGMPVGLQLVAPADADDHLLAAARWCEHALAFSRPTLPIVSA